MKYKQDLNLRSSVCKPYEQLNCSATTLRPQTVFLRPDNDLLPRALRQSTNDVESLHP